VVNYPKWITSFTPPGSDTFVYAVDNAGNIYSDVGSGSYWQLKRAVSNCTGQGLEIYNDYLYYRQNSQIGRYGDLTGSPSFTDNWKTSSDNVQTVTDWGPIKAFLDFVAFGNGRYLATWDDSTFTYNRLSWPKGYFVRDIDIMGEYLAIAVNDSEDILAAKRGFIALWDGTSTTYNFFTEVPEGGGISAIQANQDSILIFAGGKGNIYLYNGKANKIKKIPYIGAGQTVYVLPGATTNHNGMCHFGLSGGTSTTAYRGVYSWGKSELGFPDALNFEYPLSEGTTTGVNTWCSAVKDIGDRLYVGWKVGSTYGIDLVSTSTLQTSVIYESLIVTTNKPADCTRQKLYFKPLASGESITLEVKANQGSWVEAGSASYASDGAVTTKLLNYEFGFNDLEIRVTLAGSSTMPSLSKIVLEYEEDNNL